MKLNNQAAIVTGGGHGIGRAIALALAREGAHVLVCGRNEERLDQTAREIRALDRQGLAMPCDVSQEDQVAAMFEAALCAFGQLNILVNNAGIVGPTAPITSVSKTEWDETIAINLTGAFLCSKAVLPGMIARGSGKIVNIASVAGRMAYALRAPYAVSKWGVIGLTRTLAQEVGPHNIQVNAVLPGPTAGERMQRVIDERAVEMQLSSEEVEKQYVGATALKRMVDPEHIAATVLFLASPESDSITGQSVEVTAGLAL
ncbi:MAG TPA: SDR family NAD(P)-dependent oxidoreductase [Pyrinomonadaceae bacterium]|nr:SDR family NAD(P)-dependent oxidoreductase [Pyrinomonadaceae bacterium]